MPHKEPPELITFPFPPAFYYTNPQTKSWPRPQSNTVRLSKNEISDLFSQGRCWNDMHRTGWRVHGVAWYCSPWTENPLSREREEKETFEGLATAADASLTPTQAEALYAFALSDASGQFLQGGLLRAYLAHIMTSWRTPLAMTCQEKHIMDVDEFIANIHDAPLLDISTSPLQKQITVSINSTFPAGSYTQTFHVDEEKDGAFTLTFVSNELKFTRSFFETALAPAALILMENNPLSEQDLFCIIPCLQSPELIRHFFNRLLTQSDLIQKQALESIALCFGSLEFNDDIRFAVARLKLHQAVCTLSPQNTLALAAEDILAAVTHEAIRTKHEKIHHLTDILNETRTGIQFPLDFNQYHLSTAVTGIFSKARRFFPSNNAVQKAVHHFEKIYQSIHFDKYPLRWIPLENILAEKTPPHCECTVWQCEYPKDHSGLIDIIHQLTGGVFGKIAEMEIAAPPLRHQAGARKNDRLCIVQLNHSPTDDPTAEKECVNIVAVTDETKTTLYANPSQIAALDDAPEKLSFLVANHIENHLREMNNPPALHFTPTANASDALIAMVLIYCEVRRPRVNLRLLPERYTAKDRSPSDALIKSLKARRLSQPPLGAKY